MLCGTFTRVREVSLTLLCEYYNTVIDTLSVFL